MISCTLCLVPVTTAISLTESIRIHGTADGTAVCISTALSEMYPSLTEVSHSIFIIE